MKLRILGNSVRFRVSQAELAQLTGTGQVEDSVEFGPGARLVYRLKVTDEAADAIAAGYDRHGVSVVLPRALIDLWQQPDEVSLCGEQPLPDGTSLKILVEKDFTCLVPREDEDQSNLFPNPALSDTNA
ncbi:DUF7009 family protein [Candidatus Rariloculus sp.]|uniref:DUF7009 family protein n=1 Tax=Candidatus Rariloculus sp. TaxID=3101265 RepID=UPI003D11D63C